ncbi:redoxin domain-containing protein [Temperatibacter marinus]|uniref:Redoxin domain-containing protein n=1 Tax=Temperatibacter marinus TaxID=1456591 RepID=A0AA52EG57_9PROT|nr:redoxin domain-containing protein [Temperatibacter marinus]WND02200.1 redoxin domain-containing protein [Temperatibacter marinus]
MNKLLIAVFLLFGTFTVNALDVKVGKEAPDFTLKSSMGKTLTLSSLRGKTVMLEWTNHGCPYVKKHYNSGNMQKTQKALTDDGVVWLSIISSAPGKQGYVSAEEANDLSSSRGVYSSHVLLDPTGKVGKLYNAKTTPEMFLIDPKGTIQYMGAIDDKPSARPSSLKGATNYALNAWKSFKEDKEISPNTTKPYGCSVKYAD